MRELPRRPTLRAAVLGAAALSLAGCESLSGNLSNGFGLFGEKPYKPEVTPDIPAETTYNEGLARLNKGDYESAAKKFDEVDKQHPASQWSRRSLVMQAYSRYEGKDYPEAITASKRYLQLHPSSPDAAYAQYILAMSYYNQIPDSSRDQETTEKAVQAFVELIERYPKSEYAPDARAKLNVARDNLAAREMEVGRYYLTRKNYPAAINRFRAVIGQYQSTRHVEEALARLTEAYLALGVTGEAQTAAAVLGHNFPDSPWYKDSFALVKSNGLEPREDSGSWISRAFTGARRSVGL